MEIRIEAVAGDADAQAWLELRNEVALEPMAADQRARVREMGPDTVELLARTEGRLVAAAFVGSPLAEPRAVHAGCAAYVLAAERGRGVGTALYAELSRRARALGKTESRPAPPPTTWRRSTSSAGAASAR